MALCGQELMALQASKVDPAWPWVATASGIFSGEPSSTEGALTLLLPTGAQGVAMGRAVTATPGPESVFWNPAGLARLEKDQFSVFRGHHLAGDATAFSLVLAWQPVGVLGVSYQLLDLGTQELRDYEGNTIGSVSFRDHLAIVSFATQVLPKLDTGLNFKVFQEKITCRGACSSVAGTSYALDAGVLATPLESIPLRIGVMVVHVGPNLQLINIEQADPLPTRLRAAVSYEVLRHFVERPEIQLWVTGELEDRWRELGSPILYLGGEFTAGEGELFFVRAGYGQQQSGGAAGASVGLGLHYDRFDMGVAKRLSGNTLSSETEPVHISFGVSF